MKNKKKLPVKMLSGIIAATLICLILIITNAFVGNPVSQRMANKAIIQYVAKNYSSMDLEIGKVSYDFKEGAYVGLAESKTSIDTHFGVYYAKRKVQRDDYKSHVLSMFNTSQRLSDEYSTIARKIVYKAIGYADNTTMVYSKGEPEMPVGTLKLDMKFDKKLFTNAHVVLRLALDNNSLDVISQILILAHKEFVKNDCNFDTYGLYAQKGDRYFVDITEVTPSDIESSDFRNLLENAKTNRSGNGMSVLIKE